jgi:nucleotide-binding universal stress UspA family protein
MRKILIAIDGSETSKEIAVDVTQMITEPTEINLVFVVDTPKLRLLPQPELQQDLKKDLEEDGLHSLEDVENKIKEVVTQEVTVNKIVKQGRPSDRIAEIVKEKEIDHMYLGRSGKGSLDHLLTGHTTLEVVEKVNIPITIIPKKPESKD